MEVKKSDLSPLILGAELVAEIPVTPTERTTIDRTRSATVQVFEHLLQDIVTLRLKPGESISIPALSERFGTSRSPVREALIRLANTGLVETFPQSGTRISPISMDDVREVYFVRRAVEVALVEELANQRDSSHYSILKEIVEQQQVHLGESVHGFYGLDETFHQRIAELAGYPNVWGMMQNQKYHMDRLRYLIMPLPLRTSQIIDEHTAIVEGIASGDVDKARGAMSHHLQQVFVIQKVLKKYYPDYFTD